MATLTLPPPIPSSHPNFRRQKSRPENKASLLLSAEENHLIYEIIGTTSQTLATAVVQLAFPDPHQGQWQKSVTGVGCLIRDEELKSYFIEVYSLQTKSSVFSQEIYNEFEYQMFQDIFLTFEGDESMVGLNFADKSESSNFCEALNRKLKRQKKDVRRRTAFLDVNQANFDPTFASKSIPEPSAAPDIKITYGKTKKPTKKLTKLDIGRPSDFRHVQHVGFNAKKGLDFNLTDDEFREFFDQAGISANELQDENTRRFIQNFIKQHGGVQAIKSNKKGAKPGVGSGGKSVHRSPSPVPPKRPPPPARSPGRLTPNPEDFDDLPLPPPPPSPPRSPAPPDCETPPPPPPPMCCNAPLPPPPPMFNDSLPPPPPTIFDPSSVTLRKAPPKEEAPRMDLFSQILQGKTLKKVEVSEYKKTSLCDPSNDLASSLRKALEGFRGDVKPSDSESDSEEEWD